MWWVTGHISDGSMGHGSIPMTHCLLWSSGYVPDLEATWKRPRWSPSSTRVNICTNRSDYTVTHDSTDARWVHVNAMSEFVSCPTHWQLGSNTEVGVSRATLNNIGFASWRLGRRSFRRRRRRPLNVQNCSRSWVYIAASNRLVVAKQLWFYTSFYQYYYLLLTITCSFSVRPVSKHWESKRLTIPVLLNSFYFYTFLLLLSYFS